MRARLATARSFLFVPGDRPERFAKAVASGADAVILDLEDAVAPQAKEKARAAIRNAWAGLQSGDIPVVLRTQAVHASGWSDDLALATSLPGLAALMLPKAERAEDLAAAHEALPHPGLLPLIETARGWDGLEAISRSPGVVRLALGHIDFAADTGIRAEGDEVEFAPLRFALAMHTRLAGLSSPIDGVTVDLDSEERLSADTARARRFGFGGKLCIHPRQVVPVHEAFMPSNKELDWARRVVQANDNAEGAAVSVDGRMVDRPVVLLAQALLQRAERR